MLERSETNKYINYFGYIVLFGAMIVMAIIMFFTDIPGRWLIGPAVFVAGAFNSLLLFAVSEVLTRLQRIEYNTRNNTENK